MDATIVSFLPYAIQEIKPGLIPGIYRIEACENKQIPAILHIKDARSNLYVRDGKTYPITHPVEEVANAFVNDYCSAQLQSDDESRPAIFWVPGKLSAEEVLKQFPKEVSEAKRKQNNWFAKLVRLADDDWERTKQHRMITDIQRFAAKNLGQINRPWYHTPEPIQYEKCPACATLVEIDAAICYNCKHVVNKTKAKELGLAASA